MLDVRIHTVGHILDGKYKDWYVFVQTFGKNGRYLILTANNITFGKDEHGNRIKGSEGYDNDMDNIESLEHHFELHFPHVEWFEDRKPTWLNDYAD